MSRNLSNWLDSYLEYTSTDEPSKLFRKWVGISTIAAALQRKVYHSMSRIKFYPNFYIVLVGGSGSRKSTAIDVEKTLLTEVGIETSADVTSKEKLLVRLEEFAKEDDVTPPTTSSDGAVFEMPQNTHASLTAVATELTVFLKADDKDFIGYLLRLFDCDDHFRYETKTKGDTYIENVWFNLIGGTTPDMLKGMLTADVIGTGLTGRIILVYSHEPVKRNPNPEESPESQALFRNLRHDLRDIHNMVGGFRRTDGWYKKFEHWYKYVDIVPPFSDSRLAPYCNRRGAYMHKLSMIFSAARSSEMLLTSQDFDSALACLEEVEENMPDAISGVGASYNGRILDEILVYLKHAQRVSFDTVLQRFMYNVTKEELLKIISTLKQVGRVKLSKRVISPKKTDLILTYVKKGQTF